MLPLPEQSLFSDLETTHTAQDKKLFSLRPSALGHSGSARQMDFDFSYLFRSRETKAMSLFPINWTVRQLINLFSSLKRNSDSENIGDAWSTRVNGVWLHAIYVSTVRFTCCQSKTSKQNRFTNLEADYTKVIESYFRDPCKLQHSETHCNTV